MIVPVTKEHLDAMRARLIEAEEHGDRDLASSIRNEYRTACAHAYSVGDLVFGDQPDAISAIERAAGDKYWQMAKGKVREGEPLFGAALIEPGTDKIIAIGEGDSLMSAIDAMAPATER